MEKVFSVHMSGPSPVAGLNAGLSQTGFRLGRIEKLLDSGRFMALLENGKRVTVEGSPILKIGNRVRVFPSSDGLQRAKTGERELSNSPLKENGTLWSAFLPLGFGGRGASVRLQAFIEVKTQNGFVKSSRAVYFVIWTQTEKLGEIQWSIYLKGKLVYLQVFSDEGSREKEDLRTLVVGVERGLKRLGFVLAAPTVYLGRPFRVPEGFHLNLKG